MSQAHIERFYAIASKDQPLLDKMMADAKSNDDFIANAVAEGNALGYSFSVEEANAWIRKEQELKVSGELSDSQLESVAGGKGSGHNKKEAKARATQYLGEQTVKWISTW